MPEVYLDGSKIDFEDSGKNLTIGELIVSLESELIRHRRFVLELWVDGEKLDNWRESLFLKKPVSSHGDFKLNTASVDAIALEGIDIVQEYLRVIKSNITVCVRDLRIGNIGDTELSPIFEGLIEVVKTLDALTQGGGRYGIDLFKENPGVFYQPLLKNMEALKNAKDSGDAVLAADILEYELHPLIEEIEEKVFHKGV
ncbi:MAG: hypothetical protein HYS21_06830 [Deltaproteobacteria bacterium]|nr:hypothetical protein [Deltaproteobacteria bacterium]